ncbi:MAG: PIN domain-containing protein, partial [Spirochaetota bacterium]
VYANDRSEKVRHERAKQLLIDGIIQQNIAVSTQVLSEFYVTVTRKIKVKLPENTARKEIMLLGVVEIVEIDFNLVILAIDISKTNGLSYWDALIIAAAQRAKCNILYSEDLNPGQTIATVTVKNPFIE